MIENAIKQLEISQQDLSKPAFLKRKGSVFYLLLNTKSNAFNPAFMRLINQLLDQVQAHSGSTALVSLSLSKIYSGGLDLKYLQPLHVQDQKYCLMQAVALFGRMALLPFPTFCLIKGAAIAGGCIFALAHDFVLVAGKALFWANETKIQLTFPPGPIEVIKKRHAFPQAFNDMILFSKKFDEKQAFENRFIDGILDQDSALQVVTAKAQQASYLGHNKEVMSLIKCELYRQVAIACFEKQKSPNLTAYVTTKPLPKL